MFSAAVADRIMIEHGVPSDALPPAQLLHGNTLTIEATFDAVSAVTPTVLESPVACAAFEGPHR
jgi:hypothetical protein